MIWDFNEALSYYQKQGIPADQIALVSFLKEIQQENGGGIPMWAIRRIGQHCGVKENFLLAVVRRYPSLHIQSVDTLELCAGSNCGKHVQLAEFAEKYCASRGIVFRYTGCMRLCGKGPNIKWNGTIYHRADEMLIRHLAETIPVPSGQTENCKK